jgi:hypothetical protein
VHLVSTKDGRQFIAIQHISLIDSGPVPDVVWNFDNPERPVPVLVPPAAPGVPSSPDRRRTNLDSL